jgi:hypothetical protein
VLVPAITYKEEIEREFKKIQYSDKYLWYTGSIDNYDLEVKTEGDKFAFAIVTYIHDREVLVGYVSFRVDWYCSMAYNFSLIKFLDAPMVMARAVIEVMRMIESFNLHRIDFRCVSGNPAEQKYYKIIYNSAIDSEYYSRVIRMIDNIKDREGNYHDTICYELIRRK